jgi:hypothetical protein
MIIEDQSFELWCCLKSELNKKDKRFDFREKEIWFLSFGQNIGYELNGKTNYLRPCLVLKKLSKETFYGVPLTTKKKNGSWYFPSYVNKKEGCFIFSQMRLFDAKRLNHCIGKLSNNDFNKLKMAFVDFLLK